MFGNLFITYGVGLWFGAWLISKSIDADPACGVDLKKSGCFTGGDVTLVRA